MRSWRAPLTIALAVTLLVAMPATSGAKPFRTVATASDTGQYFVGPSFSRDVRRPKKFELRVTTTPEVLVEVDYSVSCSRRFDFEDQSGGFTSATTVRALPIPMREPKKCGVYVSAFYSSESDQAVRVDLELRAKQYPR